ncbi:hypothetical protein [Microseira wollei]|uniref:Uncharacterized protein n=1 Tax=Microseira wollei NIES-4236 TaxID=2530354 RepID=A0AAV3XFM6_9CYAN|nr:hypothetical protein [Microseira wollei]GET39506.1 hypothetical protein MiSe_42750 [Microseira wollei NIES-4236]
MEERSRKRREAYRALAAVGVRSLYPHHQRRIMLDLAASGSYDATGLLNKDSFIFPLHRMTQKHRYR